MPAAIIDGANTALQIRAELIPRIEALKKQFIVPSFAVVIAGNNPASLSYVGAKERASQALGINGKVIRFSGDVSQAKLNECIASLNEDISIHGILVQMPLPAHLDARKAINLIGLKKDLDGLTVESAGALMLGGKCHTPCTPKGVVELLKRYKVDIEGKHVVIIGRSQLVGRPLSVMLSSKAHNATVTLCHSHTKNLAAIASTADILVACSGQPGLVGREMVRPGACVIDVGITRIEDSNKPNGYRLVGDVNFDEVLDQAGSITPVPGGVGPMTIAMLLSNVLDAADVADAAW